MNDLCMLYRKQAMIKLMADQVEKAYEYQEKENKRILTRTQSETIWRQVGLEDPVFHQLRKTGGLWGCYE